MVAPTSKQAIQELRMSGAALKQRQKIVELLRSSKHPLTRREIAKTTRLELGTVCGRANGLVKRQIIFEGDKRECTKSKKLVGTLYALDDCG